jgi:hypothetical protein
MYIHETYIHRHTYMESYIETYIHETYILRDKGGLVSVLRFLSKSKIPNNKMSKLKLWADLRMQNNF